MTLLGLFPGSHNFPDKLVDCVIRAGKTAAYLLHIRDDQGADYCILASGNAVPMDDPTDGSNWASGAIFLCLGSEGATAAAYYNAGTPNSPSFTPWLTSGDIPAPPTLADLGGQPLPTRILTVSAAGQGGQYATIASAITAAAALAPSATNRVLIFLFPGIHTVTSLQTLPEYVDISGMGYSQITGNSNTVSPGWYNGSDATTSALLRANGNNRVDGILFKNNRTIYPAVCLYANAGSGKPIIVRNCEFHGDGQDLLYLNGSGGVTVEDCYVHCLVDNEVTDAISVVAPTGTTHVLRRVTVVAVGHNTTWLAGPGTILFDHCSFWAQEAALQGNARFGETGGTGTTVRFNYCSFLTGGTPAVGQVVSTVGPVDVGTAGVNVILDHCAYSAWNYAGAQVTGHVASHGDLQETFGSVDVNGTLQANSVQIPAGGGNTTTLSGSGVSATGALTLVSATTTATLGGATSVSLTDAEANPILTAIPADPGTTSARVRIDDMLKLIPRDDHPADAEEGDVDCLTSDHKPYFFDGTDWHALY